MSDGGVKPEVMAGVADALSSFREIATGLKEQFIRVCTASASGSAGATAVPRASSPSKANHAQPLAQSPTH